MKWTSSLLCLCSHEAMLFTCCQALGLMMMVRRINKGQCVEGELSQLHITCSPSDWIELICMIVDDDQSMGVAYMQVCDCRHATLWLKETHVVAYEQSTEYSLLTEYGKWIFSNSNSARLHIFLTCVLTIYKFYNTCLLWNNKLWQTTRINRIKQRIQKPMILRLSLLSRA